MTKTKRIDFSAAGFPESWREPAYAMLPDDGFTTPAGAAAASIARANRTHVVNLRSDGYAPNGDGPVTHHYEATFGTPCRGGGWSVDGHCWLFVDAGQGWPE